MQTDRIRMKWIAAGIANLLALTAVMAAKPTPPATPSNLSAIAVSSGQINLTWTDNATDETTYYIERSVGSSTTYSVIATLPANSTSYANTGLSASTQYNYRVRAYNASGTKTTQWSGYSNIASATTPGTTTSYTVTTSSSPTAGGTTSGGGTYASGATVTVSASPSSCYNFVSWTENGVTVTTSANYSFTVTGNRTLVANFSQKTYTVSTSSSPATGGTTSGGGSKACGSTATVTATANSGYSFANWTENGTVVSTSASYSFTVTGNRTLVANFTATTTSYTISTSSSPSNGGWTSGGGTYASGATVTVSAGANAGYTFSKWTENGVTVSTSASYSFTVTGNRSLVANFTATTTSYTVTTSSSPAAGGTTSGGGTYTSGATVTVSASANSGYSFANWTENGTVVSTAASYSFTVSGNRNLVANFTVVSSGGPWVMDIGGATADMGQGVARDAGGNILVVGYFTGNVDFGGGVLSSAGGQDIFVAKYSPSGAHLWSKRFGGSGDDAAQSVAVDLNGDVVVAGYFSGTATIGASNYTSKAGRDIFLVKLSGANGAAQWSKQIGGEAWSTSMPDDYGYGVAVDPRNGDVVLTGQISGWVDFDGTLVLNSGNTFLAKYGAGGAFQWVKTFLASYGKSVAVDGAGNIVLMGNTTGAVDLGGGLLPFNTAGGYSNFYIGKFSGAGVHLWSKCFGGYYGSFGNSVAVDGSGNAVVTGYFTGTMDFGGGVTVSGNAYSQTGFVVKLAGGSGAAAWAKAMTTTVMAAGNGVGVDPRNGDVVVTGYFQGSVTPAGGGAMSSAGGYDGFVVKYSGAGGFAWGQRLGGASSDWGNGVTADGSGNVIVTGTTNGGDFSGQALSTHGGFDIFLLKLAP